MPKLLSDTYFPKLNATVRACLLMTLLFAPSQSWARDYIVEAVVFSHAGASTEQWDASNARNQKTQNKIIARHAKARAARNPLGLSKLAGIQQALRNSAEYRVLKSFSWAQSEANYARSPLIKVSGQQLIGSIRIYAPNLLFAEINLQYAPNDLPAQLNTGSAKYFLNEKRKLKLNEIHYFDSSKVGVVLSVRPKE